MTQTDDMLLDLRHQPYDRVAEALERIATALERQIAAQDAQAAFARMLIRDSGGAEPDQSLAPDGQPWGRR